jgi:hypothetical protein
MSKFLLFTWGAVSILAQSAELTGRVTDPSGAVIPGATVEASNAQSGVRFPTVTNSEGYYTVPRLDPGQYAIQVRANGFQPVLRKGIVLQVGQTARIDIAVRIGELTQQVEIQSAAPLVESETSNLGQVINNKAIVEMPLNGRNAWDLSKLAGATVYVQSFGDAGEVPAVSMAGGRTWSQAMTLDGGSVQKSGLARAQAELSPMVDAVEEFKVITNNYAAEYGRSAAGVFTAVTKSGTNQIKGTLFEFFRNDAMDARNFFSIRKPPLRYNQFGGTVGGPIRKDRTHFFLALETTKSVRGETQVLSVPDAQRRAGSFSALRDNAGRALTVYNPFTTRQDPNNATLRLRDPFPGNLIPASLLDPVGVKVTSFYPLPNLAGNVAGANNYNTNVAARRTQYHGTVRVDHVLSSKDRLFGRYVGQFNETPQASVYAEPAASGVGGLATRNVANLASTYLGSWVRTISPALLNDLKFSTTNQNRAISHASLDQGWPSKLGLRGVSERVFPAFRPQGYSFVGSANGFRAQTNPYWQLIENVSYFRGAHSFKFGAEYRHNATTDEFDTRASGDFTFGQSGTGLQGVANSGDGMAAMLLGFATRMDLLDSLNFAFTSHYFGVYAQDDWKLTPRLTLNLGVRYDIETGRTARDNTQNGFDLTKQHPVARTAGVVTFAGQNGEPLRIFNTDRNNSSPRFGFAWRPRGDEKTVVRGGAGIFFGNPDDQAFNNSAVLGFATEALLISPDNNQTPALLLKNGVTGVRAPTAQDRTDSFGVNGPVNFYQRERATPYSIQYNFGVQHEVKGVLTSMQYVANLGRKLTAGGMSLNQIRPEFVGLAAAQQSRRPFPQFTEVTLNSPNLGQSSYHAFLTRVEKRYQNGFQFLVNYTFSKFIDNVDSLSDFGGTPGVGYMNFFNRRLDKALSSNDITHNLGFNAIYDLPWGKGRRWLARGSASHVIGGWQLSALTTMNSGPPFGVTTAQNLCECFSAGPNRANILRNPDLPASERTVTRWFDTGAFAQPARFLFGNAARSVGRAPGRAVVDLGVMKNFAVNERVRIQFRAEWFNSLNRANFGIPGTGFGAANFGTITTAADARVTQLGLKAYF